MTFEDFKDIMNNNEAYVKMKNIADKYGYFISSAFIQNNKVHINIYKCNGKRFIPDVYFKSSTLDKPTSEFRIMTTSYGSLNMDDYEKFIKCVNNAYNMVSELEKIDTSKLPNSDKYTIDE